MPGSRPWKKGQRSGSDATHPWVADRLSQFAAKRARTRKTGGDPEPIRSQPGIDPEPTPEQLRQKTVDLIAKKWDSVGVFMLGEVAGQMGCSTDQLDKEECLTYMRSKDKCGRFLWGNSVTLHCLPNIIGKSIVVLGLSAGSAFKHTLKAECSTGDVYIGFIPEVHFFWVSSC